MATEEGRIGNLYNYYFLHIQKVEMRTLSYLSWGNKDRSEIMYTKLNADILSNISDEKCINKKIYL